MTPPVDHLAGAFPPRGPDEAPRIAERFALSTLDTLPEQVCVLDDRGRIVAVNAAWRAFAAANGADPARVGEGCHYLDVCARATGPGAEEAGRFHEALRRVLEGHQASFSLEYPCHAPDRERWFVARVGRFSEGEVVRVVISHQDVTGPRRSAEALRASEERFRQLAENAREIFWLLDVPENRISYVNPAYETIWGRTCQSLYDDPEDWYDALHPDDRERVVRAYESSGSVPYDEEYRIIRPDGSLRWIRDRAVPVHDAGGRVVRVAGIAEDVTARKHTEEALRGANRALLTLVRCHEALVRAQDEQALYQDLCRVMVAEGGYRMSWVGVLEDDARRTVRPVAQAGLDEGYLASLDVVWADEERGRGPTGTAARTGRPVACRDILSDPTLAPWRAEALRRGFRSSAALPLVSDGRSIGVLNLYAAEAEAFGDKELEFLGRLAEDLAFGVTSYRARAERDRLNSQLVQADRLVAIGTLAAGVAHEINNPLAYVISSLQHVEELLRGAPAGLGPAATRQAVEALADAREGAQRVGLIVRDLKTFSRVEDVEMGPVELPRVIDSAINIARSELRHRARLVRDYRPVPPVTANEAKLGQVFLNLLVNAAQAIPAGKSEDHEVRVTTSTDELGRARVEVRDSGAGVPAELAGRIFEPFVTGKRPGEGTGLGLSICRNVVVSLGGEIGFESEPGRGSTFRVTLPAAAPEAAGTRRAPGNAPSPAPAVRRGRVAVVDDEPGVRRAVARALGGAHEVEQLDGARALLERIAGGERFDAIVCDLMMPEMTGMELHRLLQAGSPDQAEAMIFMTGGAFTPEARGFLAEVTNARIDKPFDVEVLRGMVRSLVP